MLATTGILLAALAVLCVALEATWPAAAFGAVGMWMISHAAQRFRDGHKVPAGPTREKETGPLLVTGPYFGRSRPTDFKASCLKPLPPPGSQQWCRFPGGSGRTAILLGMNSENLLR